MSDHFKSFSAVFPLIIRSEGEKSRILLHRRMNTGYMDGRWDIAGSGHVEEGETATMAVARECKEELGIDVKIEDIEFAHLSHRLSKRTYYDLYFIVNRYEGTLTIMEPDKCSELAWFELDKLPEDMIECRRAAVMEYQSKSYYSEGVEVL